MSRDRRRSAFTLIEVLIVVVIMAVLAATIIPQFSSSTKDAKESSVTFNHHTMQSQLELYRAHHLGNSPDDIGDATDGFLPQLTNSTNVGGTVGDGDNFPYGPYIDEIPANQLNDLTTVVGQAVADGDGTSGWQYDKDTGKIWPNHSTWTAP